jgi:hypothetical protein
MSVDTLTRKQNKQRSRSANRRKREGYSTYHNKNIKYARRFAGYGNVA